jgi:adenylosuccinate lyase
VGLENVALWHERDISHSSAERVALPDASICLHYMVVKLTGLIEGLEIDTERMMANLEATRGLVFSQSALLGLVETGLTRDQAYRIVQGHSMRAWEGKGRLDDLLRDDPDLEVPPETVAGWFSLDGLMEGSTVVFDRLAALTL